MAVSVEDFADYIGVSEITFSDEEARLTRALTVAFALISRELESAWREPTEPEHDLLLLEVAHNVYRRVENSTGGTGSQGQYEDAGALRAPNDALQTVRPLLRKFVMGV